jgi:hypothetical protein
VEGAEAVAVLALRKRALDIRFVDGNVQAICEMGFGDTLIWDRAPGNMRLGAVLERDGIFTLMRGFIEVKAGRTYYVDFKIQSLGSTLWELRKIE